jgi:uncharacterized protein
MNFKLGPVDLLIFQSTSFCNLDCKYCYLPDRDNKKKIDIEIIKAALINIVADNLIEKEFSIVWHAGEPTVMPLEFYEKVNLLIKEIIPSDVKVNQHIQTNATLLNQNWIDFFIKTGMKVGVSIDGPKHITDRNRVNRKGDGTFDKIMEGIALLKQNNIEFSVIAVLTSYSLDFADEIYTFFKGLGVRALCFNMDEEDGVNTKSSLDENSIEKYKIFWKKMFRLQLDKENYMHIREIHGFNEALLNVNVNVNSNGFNLGQMTQPLKIIAIDTEGFFTTFSPELLGMKDEKFIDFNFGNVKTDKFSSILENEKFEKVFNEIITGIKACRNECEYFSLCGGGAPSNKLYENGSFTSTETNFCLYSKKLLADSFLSEIEMELNIQ